MYVSHLSRIVIATMALLAWSIVLAWADEPVIPEEYGALSGQARYYYFTQHDRDKDSDTRHVKESLAVGGYLKYQTPWLAEQFRLGGAGYLSAPFPPQINRATRGGTGLLTPENNTIAVLGEAFAKGRFEESTLTVYRQRVDTPMVNPSDSRMIPNLFEAYMVESRDIDDLALSLGWIERIKKRDTSVFKYMSEVGSGMGNTERGMFLAGGDWTPGAAKARVWTYAIPDYMQMVFLQGGADHELGDDLSVHWLVQGLDQRSMGSADAGSFNVGEIGVKAGVTVSGVTLDVGGSVVDNTSNVITNSYGVYPFFNNMMIFANNRAGEKSVYLGASYDFKRIGWDGFTASVKTNFSDTPDSGRNASSDRKEYDLNMNYAFSGDLKGLSILNRWAFQHSQNNQDGMQVRLRLQYAF